eukprot:2007879-Rhodomonas_salina.1
MALMCRRKKQQQQPGWADTSLFPFGASWMSGVDIMHTVDLGVWVHLLTCISVKYDQVARKYNVLKAAEVSAIWDELGQRVRLLDPDLCMFKLNAYDAVL